MLIYVPGKDIFSHPPDVTPVIPVNTDGVMGAGLAKQFKDRHPDHAITYRDACRAGEFGIGELMWIMGNDGLLVAVLFPTKKHWQNPSLIDYIDRGLETLRHELLTHMGCATSALALPMLGCGCGGLDWIDVWSSIASHLGSLPGAYYVHGPAPERKNKIWRVGLPACFISPPKRGY